MSTEQALAERVREILVDVVEIEVDSDDADLLETGRIDSLGLVELIFAIEQESGVTLPLEELDVEHFRTARSIAELVSTLRAGEGAVEGGGAASAHDAISPDGGSGSVPSLAGGELHA